MLEGGNGYDVMEFGVSVTSIPNLLCLLCISNYHGSHEHDGVELHTSCMSDMWTMNA